LRLLANVVNHSFCAFASHTLIVTWAFSNGPLTSANSTTFCPLKTFGKGKKGVKHFFFFFWKATNLMEASWEFGKQWGWTNPQRHSPAEEKEPFAVIAGPCFQFSPQRQSLHSCHCHTLQVLSVARQSLTWFSLFQLKGRKKEKKRTYHQEGACFRSNAKRENPGEAPLSLCFDDRINDSSWFGHIFLICLDKGG
jgi:hypothetical protein